MAQAVSRRPLTTEASGSIPGQVYVRFVVNKVALGQVFPPSTSVFPCQFHSTGVPLIIKIGKKTAHLHWGYTKILKAVCEGPS
jgi:hypothetical protein